MSIRVTTVLVLALFYFAVSASAQNSDASLFLKACRENDFRQIEQSIENSIVDTPDENGCTALLYAVLNKNSQAIDLILSHNADIHKLAKKGKRNYMMPVLFWAVEEGDKDIIDHLISSGASLEATNERGMPLISYAARFGNRDIIARYKKDHSLNCVYRFATGYSGSLLHIAVERDDLDFLKQLLKDKVNPELRNEKGWTPLYLAARNSDYKMVDILLNHHASIYAVTYEYKDCPLTGESISDEMKHYLKTKETEQHPEYKAFTWKGILSGIVEDAAVLSIDQLKQYAKQNNATLKDIDSEGDTLLHYYVSNEEHMDHSVLSHLVEAVQIDVNHANARGRTALHSAAYNFQFSIVNYLLDHGANVDAVDAQGDTPLTLISRHEKYYSDDGKSEKYRMVELLLDHGADINHVNYFGQTPLIANCSIGVVTQVPVVQLLINRGARLDDQDSQFKTALHWASAGGPLQSVRDLVNAGASVNIFDLNRCSPLAVAKNHEQLKRDIMYPYFMYKDRLQNCVIFNQPEYLETLLEQGESPDRIYPGCYSDATAFILAAERNNRKMMEVLLRYGADVNAASNWGGTALHFVVEDDRGDLVKLLIDANADLHIKNKMGHSPFELAKNYSYAQAVIFAADPNLTRPEKDFLDDPFNYESYEGYLDEEARTKGGDFILHEFFPDPSVEVTDAEKDPNVGLKNVYYGFVKEDTTEEQLQKFHELLNSLAENDLIKAVLDNDIKAVKQALKDDPELVNRFDEHGLLPLTYAFVRSNKDMVDLLLEHHADINKLDRNNDFGIFGDYYSMFNQNRRKTGWAVLHYLAALNNRDMVSYALEKGAKVDLPEVNMGVTALWYALDKGHFRLAELLVQAGADVELVNKDGYSLIQKMVDYGNTYAVGFLVTHGANFELPNPDGWTPMVIAIQENCSEIVAYLLSHGSDANAVDNEGDSLLHLAVPETSNAIVYYLLQHGANVNKKNSGGLQPIFVTHYSYNRLQPENIENVRLLLEHGTDVNMTNRNGGTFLNHACRLHCVELVRLALEYGAHLKADADAEQPLLHSATFGEVTDSEFMEIMKLLTNKGYDLNQVNVSNEPILYVVLKKKFSDEIITYLLDHGADPNYEYSQGMTVLDYVKEEAPERLKLFTR